MVFSGNKCNIIMVYMLPALFMLFRKLSTNGIFLSYPEMCSLLYMYLLIIVCFCFRTSDIYSIQDKAVETGLRTPLVLDTTGLWLMRNGLGSNLLCGALPLMKDDSNNMSKTEYLENIIKPSLINRFPMCINDEVS